MTAQIGVSAPPDRVFAWLSDPGNARHWLAQLRREAEGLPDPGLEADADARTLRWSASPAGEMRVSGEGESTEIHLALDRPGAATEAPPEADAEDDPDSGAEDALRSIKSHVENVGGGDPTTHDAREVPSRLMGGGSATLDPNL